MMPCGLNSISSPSNPSKLLTAPLICHAISSLLILLPCGSDGKESACNEGDPGLIPGYRIWSLLPWRRAWQPTPVFLPGQFHGQRSLAGYSSWGREELDMAEWPQLTHYVITVSSFNIPSGDLCLTPCLEWIFFKCEFLLRQPYPIHFIIK